MILLECDRVSSRRRRTICISVLRRYYGYGLLVMIGTMGVSVNGKFSSGVLSTFKVNSLSFKFFLRNFLELGVFGEILLPLRRWSSSVQRRVSKCKHIE